MSLTPDRLSTWRWTLSGRATSLRVEAEWADLAIGQQRLVVRGEGDPARRMRHVYASQAEAERAAQGALDQGNREAMKLSATLAGFEPAIFAGGSVSITGLRPEVSGEWQVVRAIHRLQGGLTTSFDARRKAA